MMKSGGKKIFCSFVIPVLCLILFVPISSRSQLQSIKAFSDVSFALGKRFKVTDASSVGGGVQVRYALYDNFSFGITAGYKLYSLNQANQLTAWNWDFWNSRYSNTIKSNIQADPALSVEIGSVQKMDLIPVMADIEYEYAIGSDLMVVPSISTGMVFYTRRLYAVETWSKRFPSAHYVFTYSYRNFAPDKKGNLLAITPGCSVMYRLFTTADVLGGVTYTYYNTSHRIVGHGDFPISDELTVSLGLHFFY